MLAHGPALMTCSFPPELRPHDAQLPASLRLLGFEAVIQSGIELVTTFPSLAAAEADSI